MINFNLTIRNPFHNERKSPWKSLYQGEWHVAKHKTLEIGFFKYGYNLFECRVDLKWKGDDHAGPSFELTVLGWEFRIALPDTRHWHYEKNRWINYDDLNEMKELYPEYYK